MKFDCSILPTRKTWTLGLSMGYAYVNFRGPQYTGTHTFHLTIICVVMRWMWNEKPRIVVNKDVECGR